MMKILITRPRAQADDFAKKLRLAGLEPMFFPVIEIRPIDPNPALEDALNKPDCYEWVIFTSVNAVEVIFDKYSSFVLGKWQGVKFAAVGPKTAEALQARGVIPDFVPEEYVAEAILPGLGDVHGKWILLPRAEIARKDLPEAIANAGGIPHEILVYQTVPVQVEPEGLAALKAGVDVVTFTSPSTVQNFVVIARQAGLDPLHLPKNPVFACIGPITEQAAKEEGLENLMVAKDHTTEGLIEVITHMEVP